MRRRVWNKTDGHCAYCGNKLDFVSTWHVDHMQPRSRGSADNIENLIASCSDCNIRKGTRSPVNFGQVPDNILDAHYPVFYYSQFPNEDSGESLNE